MHMRIIENSSIKVKFLFMIILSSILPIIVLGIYSYDTSVKSVTEQVKNRSETTLSRVSAFIDLYMQQINDYAVKVSNNSIVIGILNNERNKLIINDMEKQAVISQMQLQNNHVNLSVKSIIISPSGRYYSNFTNNDSKMMKAVKLIMSESWYLQNDKYADSTRFLGVRKSYVDNFETNYHYYFYRNIYNGEGDLVGVFLIDISSYVFDRLLSSILNNSEDIIYLVDENFNVLSVSNEVRNEYDANIALLKEIIGNGSPANTIALKNNMIMVYTELISKKWHLIYFISKKGIWDSTKKIILFTIGLIFILSVFEFFLYLLVNKTITKPIIQLSKAMRKVQQSDFGVQFKAFSNDEIGTLANGFNKMVMDIRNSIEKIKQEERQTKKYELAMLQAQINPHFLYNSLNSIKWMADLMRCGNISQAIFYMIKLLQYSIDKIDSTITLKNEIEYIESYVFLNNIRFKDKFNFIKKVDSQYDNIRIVKFLIQPLVENSILHGLKDKPGVGNIILSVEEKEDSLIVSVEDDGIGFQPENVICNLTGDEKGDILPVHIGIENVDRRLKLIYGEEYGVMIESEVNKGTKVSIAIPFEKEMVKQ